MLKGFAKLISLIYQRLPMEPGELHYLGSGDSLPPPLEGEEEADCLRRLKLGDDSARTALIEHNLRLVVYIARKFENTGRQHLRSR